MQSTNHKFKRSKVCCQNAEFLHSKYQQIFSLIFIVSIFSSFKVSFVVQVTDKTLSIRSNIIKEIQTANYNNIAVVFQAKHMP